MPLYRVWRKVQRKIRNQVRHQTGWLRARWLGSDLSTPAFMKSLNGHFADASAFLRDIAIQQEHHSFPHCSHQQQFCTAFESVCPQAKGLAIEAADRAHTHVFDLLGSGSTHLGDKIDWHTDFKSGHRFDPKQYYRDVRAASFPGGYDIKVPWELSRCQHFAWLGQAYTFTKNEKYAQEFVAQTEDWISSNPWPWGVNWTCTMDVAMRVVNWLWGYAFFKESPSLSDEFRLLFHKSLLIHGRHIFSNLENQGETPGNHYLANLVGLIYQGILCPEFKEAQQWRQFGLRELEREMFKQVYADGVNFEASTSYHRLVLEMFLSATILARLNGHTFSPAYMERLEQMVEFILYLTKPDGTAPLIGDNDNGRLHRLKVWQPAEREWSDFRYLLAIGAVLFKREDFAQAAEDQWEEAIWLFGEAALNFWRETAARQLPPVQLASRTFADAGYYVSRHDAHYVIVNAGPVGNKGSRGHAHNDTFSIELFAHGQNWIVDPGAYVYTADYLARNCFRSTASHNTVRVGREEQNRFRAAQGHLFELRNEDEPEVYDWRSNDQYDFLHMAHRGFKGLSYPVEHQRQVFFHKETGNWLIRDQIAAAVGHDVEWFWHFAPSVTFFIQETAQVPTLVATNPTGKSLHMTIQAKSGRIHLAEKNGFVSAGYGLRSEAPVLYCTTKSERLTDVTFGFMPVPNATEPDCMRSKKQELARAWQCYNEVLASRG